MSIAHELDQLWEVARRAGVSDETFWHGDVSWTWARVRDYEKKLREDWKKKDAEQWQLGIYIQKAIASCFNKDAEYPKRQIFYDWTDEENIENAKADMSEMFKKMKFNK